MTGRITNGGQQQNTRQILLEQESILDFTQDNYF